MKNLNNVFLNHATRARNEDQDRIMRGMFFDCHGTLFDKHGEIRPMLLALLRASKPVFGMTPYVISADLGPHRRQLEAEGIDKIAQFHDKMTLNDQLMRDDKLIEFLVDDDPMFGMDYVTHIHPLKLLPLLEDEKQSRLARFIPASLSL